MQKEREAFELSFKSTQIYRRECAIRGKDILEFSKTMNGYFNIVANDAWNMWLDAKTQAVPKDSVVVSKWTLALALNSIENNEDNEGIIEDLQELIHKAQEPANE